MGRAFRREHTRARDSACPHQQNEGSMHTTLTLHKLASIPPFARHTRQRYHRHTSLTLPRSVVAARHSHTTETESTHTWRTRRATPPTRTRRRTATTTATTMATTTTTMARPPASPSPTVRACATLRFDSINPIVKTQVHSTPPFPTPLSQKTPTHPATTTEGGGCCGGHDGEGGAVDTAAPPVARTVLPGDCVKLDPEEEALAVVGTQGLKVRRSVRGPSRQGRASPRVYSCACGVSSIHHQGLALPCVSVGVRACVQSRDRRCRPRTAPVPFTFSTWHNAPHLMAQVTKIAGLEGMVKLKELTLRSSLIGRMEGLGTLTGGEWPPGRMRWCGGEWRASIPGRGTWQAKLTPFPLSPSSMHVYTAGLVHLELYDNQIAHLEVRVFLTLRSNVFLHGERRHDASLTHTPAAPTQYSSHHTLRLPLISLPTPHPQKN